MSFEAKIVWIFSRPIIDLWRAQEYIKRMWRWRAWWFHFILHRDCDVKRQVNLEMRVDHLGFRIAFVATFVNVLGGAAPSVKELNEMLTRVGLKDRDLTP